MVRTGAQKSLARYNFQCFLFCLQTSQFLHICLAAVRWRRMYRVEISYQSSTFGSETSKTLSLANPSSSAAVIRPDGFNKTRLNGQDFQFLATMEI